MSASSCSACLGMQECWICSGDGCSRCGHTGACHVCAALALATAAGPQPDGTPSRVLTDNPYPTAPYSDGPATPVG